MSFSSRIYFVNAIIDATWILFSETYWILPRAPNCVSSNEIYFIVTGTNRWLCMQYLDIFWSTIIFSGTIPSFFCKLSPTNEFIIEWISHFSWYCVAIVKSNTSLEIRALQVDALCPSRLSKRKSRCIYLNKILISLNSNRSLSRDFIY